LFCCDSQIYAEIVPGTTFKEYPKYSYIPYKASRKPQYLKLVPLNLTDLFRDTPFIFKGDPGRPRAFIQTKVTPISRHKHIKIITASYYLIYRNSIEVQRVKEKNIVYKTILKLSGEILEEVLPTSKDIKEPKNGRGIKTL